MRGSIQSSMHTAKSRKQRPFRLLPLLLAALLLCACAAQSAPMPAPSPTAEAAPLPTVLPAPTPEAQTLDMEELIRIFGAREDWESDIRSEGLDFFARYANMQENPPATHSVTQSCRFHIPHAERDYALNILYYPEESAAEYGLAPGAVSGVYLQELSTGDTRLLYSGDGRYTPLEDLNAFLAEPYDIEAYLSFTLPEGVRLGAYRSELMFPFQGCPFEGDFPPPLHAASAPNAWTLPGGIGVCPDLSLLQYGEGADALFRFEGGELANVSYHGNHMERLTPEGERIENGDFSALLYEYAFELFTAAELEEYEAEHGLELPYEDTLSHYYYVFFANEGEDRGYAAFFNRAYFEKADVEAFMQSVKKAQ